MKTPQIKICGLTRKEEAEFLNRQKADYAGFVFFEESKRNVSLTQAIEIKQKLNPAIQTVAVTVSPDKKLVKQIEAAGFAVLQVHGVLKPEILEYAGIPIWRACNLKEPGDIRNLEQHEKITGYVIDAGTAGSGRTFDWNGNREALEKARGSVFDGKKWILAGGLHPENVSEGIEIFSPDVVDVSSGVEGANGKEERLIAAFIRKVREHEAI